MRLGLGIDTGGTYTDAVLLDFDTGQTLCKAKSLTTYPNLEVGIEGALDGLERKDPNIPPVAAATLVAVSTTLATNAMVEGKGGHVCLLAVGYLPNLLEEKGVDKQPFVQLRRIAGGHNTEGEERSPLDVAAAERVIEETKDFVDAYAVVAFGSPFNPAHEIRLVELVREKTDLPVVSGIEFSRELDSIKRATTALFNARLTPLVQQFIRTMQRLLSTRGITAPLMIVKGDGHLMRAELAIEHPIETVLSGPAASFIGARYLSNCQDAIVLDMGGTTTDIAALKDGTPRIDAKGAVVAGWRTCVRAAEIHTSGIGGDSHLRLNSHNEITVGPQRVIPIAFASAQYPTVLAQLKELEAAARESTLVQPCDFLVCRHNGKLDAKTGSPLHLALIERLQDKPRSLWHLAKELGITHPSLLRTTDLESRGYLARIGLTPTDLLHAQGVFTDWDVEAAACAIRMYATRLGVDRQKATAMLQAAIDQQLAAELVTVLLNQDDDIRGLPRSTAGRSDHLHPSIRDFLMKKISSNGALSRGVSRGMLLQADNSWSVDVKVRLPLIGIGAPAHAYLPRVASALQAEVKIPEHAEVANAVGAIVGGIVETVEIDVHPVYTVVGIDRYEVRSPIGVDTFQDGEAAIHHAMELGKKLAIDKAQRAGAKQVEVKIESANQEASTGCDYTEPIYLGTQVRATGIGNRQSMIGKR